MSECPCDSCKYKGLNFQPPNKCPNFQFFFDAFMSAYDGVLKTNRCEKWEEKEPATIVVKTFNNVEGDFHLEITDNVSQIENLVKKNLTEGEE